MPKALSDLPRLDLALALALLAVKLVTLATGVQPGPAVSYVAAPFWTLPLAWRRTDPLRVVLVIMGTAAAEVALVGYHDSVVDLAVFVLLPYSVGAYARSAPQMIAGLAAVAAGGAVSSAAQDGAFGITVLGNAAIILVPFFAGLAMRQQRLRAQALERLAAQLEHEREERARSAVVEERGRIARELHDEVAHAMSVIAVQADAAEGALLHDPGLVRSPLVAIRETARGALTDMRRVLGALHDGEHTEFEPGPGLAQLESLLEQTRAAGVEVDLVVEGDPAPLAPTVDLAAYRVVQEGLTNVRKHSAASRVRIVLRYGRDAIAIDVDDDGDGSGGGGGTGRGLVGIRERVAVLGGQFVAAPLPTGGFALRVTLPLA